MGVSDYDVTELCSWVSERDKMYPNNDYRFHVMSLDKPNNPAGLQRGPAGSVRAFGLRVARTQPLMQ